MYEILKQDYIVYKNKDGKLPLHLKGLLRGGTYCMDTSITSQTISAMLFALPLLESDSKIKLTQKPSSKNYVDMTLSMLKHCGIHIDCLSEAGEFSFRESSNINPLIIGWKEIILPRLFGFVPALWARKCFQQV